MTIEQLAIRNQQLNVVIKAKRIKRPTCKVCGQRVTVKIYSNWQNTPLVYMNMHDNIGLSAGRRDKRVTKFDDFIHYDCIESLRIFPMKDFDINTEAKLYD